MKNLQQVCIRSTNNYSYIYILNLREQTQEFITPELPQAIILQEVRSLLIEMCSSYFSCISIPDLYNSRLFPGNARTAVRSFYSCRLLFHYISSQVYHTEYWKPAALPWAICDLIYWWAKTPTTFRALLPLC